MRTTTLLLAALTIAPAAAFAMPGYGPGHHQARRAGFSGNSAALLNIGTCNRRVVRYRSGAVAAHGACVRGLKEGHWQSFNRRGRLTASANFWRGQHHGLWLSYGVGGQVLHRGVYRTGRRHGAWFNGANRTTVHWHMGRRRARKARRAHVARRHRVVVGGPARVRAPNAGWSHHNTPARRVRPRFSRSYNRTYDAATHRTRSRTRATSNARAAERSRGVERRYAKGHRKGGQAGSRWQRRNNR